jgi:hypothetical protein
MSLTIKHRPSPTAPFGRRKDAWLAGLQQGAHLLRCGVDAMRDDFHGTLPVPGVVDVRPR